MENARLKAEIHKLRIENVDLMRRAKFADCNAHHMRVNSNNCHILTLY